MKRFWDKVDVGDCWLWTAATSTGYGRFWDGERLVQAHRWAYETLVAPVPEGLDLDHMCRVRACVNPDHLQPVTRSTNLLRGNVGIPRGYRFETCKSGRHPLQGPSADVQTYSDGSRECRPCRLEARRERYAKTKVA